MSVSGLSRTRSVVRTAARLAASRAPVLVNKKASLLFGDGQLLDLSSLAAPLAAQPVAAYADLSESGERPLRVFARHVAPGVSGEWSTVCDVLFCEPRTYFFTVPDFGSYGHCCWRGLNQGMRRVGRAALAARLLLAPRLLYSHGPSMMPHCSVRRHWRRSTERSWLVRPALRAAIADSAPYLPPLCAPSSSHYSIGRRQTPCDLIGGGGGSTCVVVNRCSERSSSSAT